nr:hypothetical protein [Micromonospora sp. DSM 115978]
MAVVAAGDAGIGLATARGSWAVRAKGAFVLAEVEMALAPRWVWWSARSVVPFLVAAGVRPAVCWDLAAVHRVLGGGRRDDPGAVWAGANGLPPPAESATSGRGPRQDGQLDLLA